MLKKSNRVRKTAVLDALFRTGKIYKDPLFIFRYKQALDGESRFAVTVSKKFHKKAVHRNRLRRQIFEAVRLCLPQLKTRILCSVSVRAGLKKVDFREIEQSINHFFHYLSHNVQ